MFIPKRGSEVTHFADPKRVTVGPLEVVFTDLPPYWHPPEHADLVRGVCKEYYSPVDGATGTGHDWFITGWNSSFHLGHGRNLSEFTRLCPIVSQVRNPNIAIAPRIAGYSELHGLLAALCPDEVLASHRLSRRPASFLLAPVSVACDASESADCFERRLGAEAKACCRAFRDYVWQRLRLRGRAGDYDEASSMRVLLDDSAFWMNAAYRAGIARARTMLRPIPGVFPTELMDRERMLDLFGHVMSVPAMAADERAEVRYVDRRVVYRIGAFRPVPPGDRGDDGSWSEGLGPGAIAMGAGGNTLEECQRNLRELQSLRFRPHRPEFVDTGVDQMPTLREGEVWNLADAAGRDQAFADLLGQPEQASIAPILALLQGEALPEDFPDRGFSYLKEDMQRRFHRKPRKGQRRMQVICVETVDDHAVVDPSTLFLIDDDDVAGPPTLEREERKEQELLRSVMVLLEPKEQKIVLLLRVGRSQNEIARELGLANHSGVSRMIAALEPRVRRALALEPPAAPRRSRQRREGGGGA